MFLLTIEKEYPATRRKSPTMIQHTKTAPIVVFAYRRLDELAQSIESLQACDLADSSDLIIFSDGPKSTADAKQVAEVRRYLKSIEGFARVFVHEHSNNLGLADSVIEGVTKTVRAYGRAIVVEDDIVCAPQFLRFMNECLNRFSGDSRIFSLSGYSYPFASQLSDANSLYLSRRASSWGWATWQDRWQNIDWSVADYTAFRSSWIERRSFAKGGADLPRMLDLQMRGRINSWAIRFNYAMYKQKRFCIYPRTSLVKNIGFGGFATHSSASDLLKYEVQLDHSLAIPTLTADLSVSPAFDDALRRLMNVPLHRRINNRLIRLFQRFTQRLQIKEIHAK
jgi:glycosyltransferase involved in cell wall biosynthesis